MSEPVLTVRKDPCPSCPYRLDAPSGLWERDEYEKLIRFDGDVPEQIYAGAFNAFSCHLQTGQLCAGWVGCHGPDNLLALRLLALRHRLDPSVMEYETDVPLHPSGQAAYDYGVRDVDDPDAVTLRKAAALKRLHDRRNGVNGR